VHINKTYKLFNEYILIEKGKEAADPADPAETDAKAM
jgi:hypothetical protein